MEDTLTVAPASDHGVLPDLPSVPPARPKDPPTANPFKLLGSGGGGVTPHGSH